MIFPSNFLKHPTLAMLVTTSATLYTDGMIFIEAAPSIHYLQANKYAVRVQKPSRHLLLTGKGDRLWMAQPFRASSSITDTLLPRASTITLSVCKSVITALVEHPVTATGAKTVITSRKFCGNSIIDSSCVRQSIMAPTVVDSYGCTRLRRG